MTIDAEFDRQRDALLAARYPEVLGTSAAEVAAVLEPLRGVVEKALDGRWVPPTSSAVPFVLVVSGRRAPAEALVPLMRLDGGDRPGILDRNHGEQGLSVYRPLPEMAIPDADAYALLRIERGEEFCGIRPEDALEQVVSRGRTPLTIHEGIALVTLHPAVLERNRCFMLSGSRRGDRRVPAIWISKAAPKLGWCWAGNPHSWLGTASAAGRAA